MSKPNATRKPYSRQLSIGITNRIVDRIISQKHHEEYLAEKEMFNNSYEGQVDVACRGLLQETSKRLHEINKQYVQIVEDSANDLFNMTKDMLLQQCGDLSSLTLQQIENFMGYSRMVFKNLERMCNDAQYLAIVKNNQSNDYDKLFKRLIEEINPQFIFFAPEKFIKLTTPFKGMHKMPQESKEKLFARVQELGLDKDYRYMDLHRNIFASINMEKQQKSENETIEA